MLLQVVATFFLLTGFMCYFPYAYHLLYMLLTVIRVLYMSVNKIGNLLNKSNENPQTEFYLLILTFVYLIELKHKD